MAVQKAQETNIVTRDVSEEEFFAHYEGQVPENAKAMLSD